MGFFREKYVSPADKVRAFSREYSRAREVIKDVSDRVLVFPDKGDRLKIVDGLCLIWRILGRPAVYSEG